MKHQNLPTFLEAAAITVCLILFAGQPGEARTLTSQTTIKTFHEGLNESITLVVGHNPTGSCEKQYAIDSGTDGVAGQ